MKYLSLIPYVELRKKQSWKSGKRVKIVVLAAVRFLQLLFSFVKTLARVTAIISFKYFISQNCLIQQETSYLQNLPSSSNASINSNRSLDRTRTNKTRAWSRDFPAARDSLLASRLCVVCHVAGTLTIVPSLWLKMCPCLLCLSVGLNIS